MIKLKLNNKHHKALHDQNGPITKGVNQTSESSGNSRILSVIHKPKNNKVKGTSKTKFDRPPSINELTRKRTTNQLKSFNIDSETKVLKNKTQAKIKKNRKTYQTPQK